MAKRGDVSSIDIQKVLLDMREYRMGLIQTPDQLRFSYMAVIEGARLILKGDQIQVCSTGPPVSLRVTCQFWLSRLLNK